METVYYDNSNSGILLMFFFLVEWTKRDCCVKSIFVCMTSDLRICSFKWNDRVIVCVLLSELRWYIQPSPQYETTAAATADAATAAEATTIIRTDIQIHWDGRNLRASWLFRIDYFYCFSDRFIRFIWCLSYFVCFFWGLVWIVVSHSSLQNNISRRMEWVREPVKNKRIHTIRRNRCSSFRVSI